jgi:glutamate/tyrosine decarboxylase-like PLP-dependent enzyme
MTATMLGGADIGDGPGSDTGVAGTLSSGGSESIQLAMKTYRDHARATRGITQPQMIVPMSAHAAFDKAAQYFGIEIVHIPTGPDWRADVAATEAAITDDTIVIVGSSPSFPHGVIDPIEELSELARSRGIGFHTDACLGGFVVPWAEKLGYPVPPFDFRLPGVTSMSADTHKYGYAAKGTSVVLYRSMELRHHQYFTITDWPGGLYASPSFAGSRPGALSAACWAALVSVGEEGYLDATRRILAVADEVKAGLRDGFPELEILGDPLYVIAVRSADASLDVFRVLDAMTARGWSLNGLHRPAAFHLCVTLRHTKPGFTERFLADLRAAIDHVRANPDAEGGMAPIYGMADTIPERGLVSDAMLDHMDGWYRLP